MYRDYDCKALILLVMLMIGGTLATPALGTQYFRDDFSEFAGWTYTPASEGLFASSGTYAYVYDWQSGSCAIAEKAVDLALAPSEDFSFTLNLSVSPDFPDSVGGFHVSLLNGTDTVVAKMGWHDAQAGTGYGGVDFYGEAETAIYRSGPSGFATEYPDFSGTLMLERAGSQWTAWVNGQQKGLPLTLAATLTAVKVRMEATRSLGYTDRAFEIDDLAVVPEPAALILLGPGSLLVLRRRKNSGTFAITMSDQR